MNIPTTGDHELGMLTGGTRLGLDSCIRLLAGGWFQCETISHGGSNTPPMHLFLCADHGGATQEEQKKFLEEKSRFDEEASGSCPLRGIQGTQHATDSV